MNKTKYFLDIEADNRATLYTVEDHEEVWSGQFESLGKKQ